MKISNYLLAVFCLIICITSLINQVNANNISLEKHQFNQNYDTLPVSFGCYYKLDDKYSQSQDTKEINEWLQGKLKEIEVNGITDNLFEHKGGGPNGAEWNVSTDLFIVTTINKTLKDEAIELMLNKKKVPGIKISKYQPYNKKGTIIYLKLPFALWEKYLRKMKKSCYNERFLEISLSVNKKGKTPINLKQFFYVAYGE